MSILWSKSCKDLHISFIHYSIDIFIFIFFLHFVTYQDFNHNQNLFWQFDFQLFVDTWHGQKVNFITPSNFIFVPHSGSRVQLTWHAHKLGLQCLVYNKLKPCREKVLPSPCVSGVVFVHFCVFMHFCTLRADRAYE